MGKKKGSNALKGFRKTNIKIGKKSAYVKTGKKVTNKRLKKQSMKLLKEAGGK